MKEKNNFAYFYGISIFGILGLAGYVAFRNWWISLMASVIITLLLSMLGLQIVPSIAIAALIVYAVCIGYVWYSISVEDVEEREEDW